MKRSVPVLCAACLVPFLFSCFEEENPSDSGNPASKPVITSVAADLEDSTVVSLQVEGENFSENIKVAFDGNDVELEEVTGTSFTLPVGKVVSDGNHTIEIDNDGYNAMLPFYLLKSRDVSDLIWKGALDEAPADPEKNWIYRNGDENAVYIWDGSEWQILVAGAEVINGKSIVWKGSFADAPEEPEENWAYFNTAVNVSYIWDGEEWDTLAAGVKGEKGDAGEQGEAGANGADGADGAPGTNGSDGLSIIWKGSLSAAPESPETNWAYFNTGANVSYIWDGGEWDILAAGVKGEKGDAGEDGADGTAGADGTNGADGIDGADGKSIVWKGSLSAAPESPEENWAYFNTTSSISFIYDGAAWDTLSKSGEDGSSGSGSPFVWKGSSATEPQDPEVNWAYYNTVMKASYIFNGELWDRFSTGDADMLNLTVSGSTVTNNQAPTLKWSAKTEPVGYRYRWSDSETWTAVESYVYSYTPSEDLEEGSYTFVVSAQIFENTYSEEVSFTFSIDLTPPDAPVVTSPGLTNNPRPTWTWNYTKEEEYFRYQLNGTDENGWTTVDPDTMREKQYTSLSDLAEGDYTLYVQARDAAGNWSASGSGTATVNLSMPEITTHPASQTADDGAKVKFIVISGGDNLSYQWQKNEMNIVAAVDDSLVIEAVSSSEDGARYRCIVYNNDGVDTSDVAVLNVRTLVQELIDDISGGDSINEFGYVWVAFDDNRGVGKDDRPTAGVGTAPSEINVGYTLVNREAFGDVTDDFKIKQYAFATGDSAGNLFATLPFTFGDNWVASWCSKEEACAEPFVGITTLLADYGQSRNLQDAERITFKARSHINELNVRFRVETKDIDDDSTWAYYEKVVAVNSVWNTFTVNLDTDDLSQPDWISAAYEQDFAKDIVTKLTWEVHGDYNSDAVTGDTLDIDDVYIVK